MAVTVCILCAGRGTRMGELGRSLHKALFPLGEKAALTHIFEAFPGDSRFVIAMGDRAQQIRDFVELAHPQLRVEFVEVDPYAGPGSGPGRSALACAAAIRDEAFYLVCSDTLWAKTPPPGPGDWIATHPVAEDESRHYCNLRLEAGRVREIRDKTSAPAQGHEAFTGLAFIANAPVFFDGLRGDAAVEGERQLSAGFAALLANGAIEARRLEGWIDIGTEDRYRRATDGDPSLGFAKGGEAFYRAGNRVVKYFADASVAADRVRRARKLADSVPCLVGDRPNFYAYEYVSGRTFYLAGDPAAFSRLLDWLDATVWLPVAVPAGEVDAACDRFYRARTFERLDRLFENDKRLDSIQRVDGRAVASIVELLGRVPWHALRRGTPVRFHGDLQFDNILRSEGGGAEFRLLDWRQDFAGALHWGDLGYDYAKLLAGIRLDFSRLKAGELAVTREGRAGVRLRLPVADRADEYEMLLRGHAERRGFDFDRVRLIAALVYLNMAPLHHGALRDALFLHARRELSQALDAIAVPSARKRSKHV